METISLEMLLQHNRDHNIKPKVYHCDDCDREITKAELNWCKQNYQWKRCFMCQKNHATIATMKAFTHSNWDISFQWKYFKPKKWKNDNN